MALIGELIIPDDKIKANQAQYDLDREAAKISKLSSREIDKYEYLTGEDLGYKPGVVEKVEFQYSPLDQVSSKGLKQDDKVNKVVKYDNGLTYSFDEISLIDSKFDEINNFYNNVKKLEAVKSQT